MAAHTNTSKLAIIMAMQIIVMIFASMEIAKAHNYGAVDQSSHIICGISTEDLYLCRPAVVGPTAVPPSPACCAALQNADLLCLCAFYKNSKPLLAAFGIDPALAMQLPAKCNPLQYSSHC